MSSRRKPILVVLGLGLLIAAGAPASDDVESGEMMLTDAQQERLMQRYQRMIDFNLDNEHTLPSAIIDSLMAEFQSLPIGARIAGWADYFWRRGDAGYLFGLKPGGYVTAGRLVDDFATDCILFFYRVLELGRSSSALEAVQFAFGTRFYGAALEEVVSPEGRVDYDNPVHLDYTIDIIRSGIWGKDVTATLGPVERDLAGSTRYAPGSVDYVPGDAVRLNALQSGDVVYFVSNDETPYGERVRASGALIGHVGLIQVTAGRAYLVHPASAPLDGVYAGGKVEKVPLQSYLDRVESFKGILATRVESF